MLLVLLFVASSAFAQERGTAYEALRVIGTQFNRAALSRVISVTGVDGDPQPTRWTVLIADRGAPAGIREFVVAKGRIISNRTPSAVAGSVKGATIKTSQLNLDSSGAFEVTSHTADKSHQNFDLVSYALRTNYRGNPTWIVTIQNQARRPLGTIHINANRGNVTRVEGMYRGRNMDEVVQDPIERSGRDIERRVPEPDEQYLGDDESNAEITQGDDEIEEGDGDENFVKAEIKRRFRQTKRGGERIFERARRNFDDFISRR
ncbi:MAG: hypothetical protein H0U88_05715 [Chthoniobacterales bacterium]|nr:hypothetical protein [Chthoniobacterales bacterium]